MHRPLDPKCIEVVDDAIAEILRRKTPQERVAMCADTNRAARLLLASNLRKQHADWSDEMIRRQVARRMLRLAHARW